MSDEERRGLSDVPSDCVDETDSPSSGNDNDSSSASTQTRQEVRLLISLSEPELSKGAGAALTREPFVLVMTVTGQNGK
jgi:hypothetical protein